MHIDEKFLVSTTATISDGYDKIFKTIQEAVDAAGPGDLVEIEAGSYSPFKVTNSGLADNPIQITSVTGLSDVKIDGLNLSTHALVSIIGQSYVSVANLHLVNAPNYGIYVEGSESINSGIKIENNFVDTTANSGIHVNGVDMKGLAKLDTFYLEDITIRNNEVTRTNIDNGVNEAISLGAGVNGFIIENNHVHSTDQYGIDVKAGAQNGVISSNFIHDVEFHGIYIDAGSRTIANIVIEKNEITDVLNGIVIARESRRDPEHPNIYNIEIIDNSIKSVTDFGILVYRHVDDSGEGAISGVSIDSNQIEGAGQDGIRVANIGDFSSGISVVNNSISNSHRAIWENSGAHVENNQVGSLLVSQFDPSFKTSLWARDGDEFLAGTNANDVIWGLSGNDTLIGHDGDDTLNGGQGDDLINAGAGDDYLVGGAGNDTMRGGAGNDVIRGYAGNDLVWGDTGDDFITLGSGDDVAFGEEGNDTIEGGLGSDTIWGGDGHDVIAGNEGNDFLNGGIGEDTITGGAGDDELSGEAGRDLLFGGEGNDTIRGGAGDDILYGGVGGDILYGGFGEDTIFGEEGDDVIYGGAGDDVLWGGTGVDSIAGGDGNDKLGGGAGNDVLRGNDGDDVIYGNSGDDTIYGGDGADSLFGGLGDDVIFGGVGSDRIFGTAGDNKLFGGEGDDFITGGDGNDMITGDAGNDVLFGGLGSDEFMFAGHFGADEIKDFDVFQDILIFQDAENTQFLHENTYQGTLITVSGDTEGTIVLINVFDFEMCI